MATDIQLSKKEMKDFIKFQQDEINATEIYHRLGMLAKSENNRKVLIEMSNEEHGHYTFISKYTKKEMKYNPFKVNLVCLLAHIFGLMFVLKMLEKDESLGVESYKKYEQLAAFAKTEDEHEDQLLDMIDENMLKYMGSIVLGLNDALVEFTGALAGYTLALSNCGLVALTGSITGIAAALSMGSSEYLSTKSDTGDSKHALRSAMYTSIAYLVTVFVLIAPYIWIPNALIASIVMLIMAIAIIAIFNFYYTVVRNEKFKRRFIEMAIISFSVALLSFIIGYLLKEFTGIEG